MPQIKLYRQLSGDYGIARPGQIVEVDEKTAEQYEARGLGERVRNQPAKPAVEEQKATAPTANKAIFPPSNKSKQSK